MKNITLADLENLKIDLNSGALDREAFYQECVVHLIQHPDKSKAELARELNIAERTMQENIKKLGFETTMQSQYQKMTPKEQDQFLKLLKKNQRDSDKMRVERTAFRKSTRLVNALEEVTEKLERLFAKKNLSSLTKKHNTQGKQEYVGVLHLSDLHINEKIDLAHNKFDIEIASKRLQKHVDNAKKVFKLYNVTEVVIAFTGDLMNSDRRLDELLMNATNRANATFVAVDILQQVILDVNQDFNVRCANVTGNESRVGKDIGWVNDMAQDNFDFMIYNTLAYLFKGSNGVKFLKPDDTFTEKVVNVAGQNLLLMHGHNGFANDTDRKIASKIGQYAQKGIFIDYIIQGHIHSCVVGDLHARSSGLPGSNNYSENALNLAGRASQNIYIFGNNGDRHGMKIDLQEIDGYDGYNYKQLDIYDN